MSTPRLIIHVKEPSLELDLSLLAPKLGGKSAKLGGKSDPTGHAFIELVDADGNSTFRGFYPTSDIDDATSAFSSVEGVVSPDDAGHSVTQSISYDIGEGQFNKMMAEIQNWEASPPKYNLFTNNCTTFVLKIMQAGGISPPRQLSVVDSPSSLSPAISRTKAWRG